MKHLLIVFITGAGFASISACTTVVKQPVTHTTTTEETTVTRPAATQTQAITTTTY